MRGELLFLDVKCVSKQSTCWQRSFLFTLQRAKIYRLLWSLNKKAGFVLVSSMSDYYKNVKTMAQLTKEPQGQQSYISVKVDNLHIDTPFI